MSPIAIIKKGGALNSRFSVFLIIIVTSCSSQPKVKKSKKGSPNISNLPSSGPLNLVVEVPSDRFQNNPDQDVSYLATYSGRQEEGVLNFSKGLNRIILDKVPSSGNLFVSFRLGNKVIFTVDRKALDFQNSISSSFKIRSCHIIPEQWEGLQNLGSCKWSVREM